MSNDSKNNKVVSLKVVKGGQGDDLKPNSDVIESLERVLDQARKGYVQGIAIAVVTHDGDRDYELACQGGVDEDIMIASIAVMQHKFITRVAANATDFEQT